ncbi:ABC transporter substrate-binding protein [Sulfurirhabdus autotrophica]|uniref:ABC-type branched-subunit amino acid transport system substrate-binding protein n=1 Tax=Sulfurirhabdus autotrophica TaxID=1706046 RepID=A0A4R3Y6R3_9PROT|nr:ABC transporter substrate-binding protein [Sulfurirhabdus autotrophica]TCV85913.1 ABC-type branched-subunit amino acid transport system substrate-binding protein [Sulfurirhabdus autotrophica]
MKRFFSSIFFSCIALSNTSFAEVGVTDSTIKLGQSAALTGPASELGTEMRDGANAYFESVNRKGGVNGRKIQLISMDDGYEPARTIANTKKLIDEEKVLALFGYVGTPTSKEAIPIFTAAKVPFIGAFTGAELLRTPVNHYIMNVRASYFDETEKIVRQLTSLGMKNIAVFYQNDAYGKAGLTGVEQAMNRRNLKIISTGTFERNTTDVSTAVNTIAKSNPQAVVMIGAYKACAEYIRQSKKAGMNSVQFFNVSFVGSRALAAELGADGRGVAVSQVVPFPWNTANAIVKEYQEGMKQFSQSGYSFTSLEGFIAAKVLVEGMKRAGKDLTREKLIIAMESMSKHEMSGFYVDYSPTDHNASNFVDITIIGKDGKFQH